MGKIIECVIEPDYIESFEVYCEENNIQYEFIIYDNDGLHVMMDQSDYLKWYTAEPTEEDLYW